MSNNAMYKNPFFREITLAKFVAVAFSIAMRSIDCSHLSEEGITTIFLLHTTYKQNLVLRQCL